MKGTAVAGIISLVLFGSQALSQTPVPSMPNMGDMANMSPEEMRRMADEMIIQMGVGFGIDPEVMRAASDEERQRLLEEAASNVENEMRQNVEAQTGMTFEELSALSDEESEALSRRLFMRPIPEWEPIPLDPFPLAGFADGSMPLPVDESRIAQVTYDPETDGEAILVAVDSFAREILFQETLPLPISHSFEIDRFRVDPSALIFEIINTDTHRVLARFRPVAAE